jgi:hypothetical protein
MHYLTELHGHAKNDDAIRWIFSRFSQARFELRGIVEQRKRRVHEAGRLSSRGYSAPGFPQNYRRRATAAIGTSELAWIEFGSRVSMRGSNDRVKDQNPMIFSDVPVGMLRDLSGIFRYNSE